MKNVDLLTSHGVDVNAGLEIWGDMDGYNDGLKEYFDSLLSKEKELENYKNNHDYENYAILAHSMKSESKYFGLMNEANIFLEHELKGKESDGEFIESHFEELVNTINNIYNLLREYFSLGGGVNTNDISC